jgi:vanillate O-demethylase ferredoxin subunit
VVARLRREAGITRLELRDPEGWTLPPFRPGAHIDVQLPGGALRSYSLMNDPALHDRYEIAVKEEPGGRGGSRYLCNELRPGDELGVSLPRGGYEIIPPDSRLIAGGIGVTPFLSVARSLLRQGRQDAVLHWITRGSPAFSDLLPPLMEAGILRIHDTQQSGRPALAGLIEGMGPTSLAACCGPEGLLTDFATVTRALDPSQVCIERFVPLPAQPDPAARPYTLVLAQSRRRVAVSDTMTMRDALLAAGVAVPLSCGGGICGACKVRWLSGIPIHRDRFLKPQERSQFLLSCVALSAGPELVLDL